MKINIVQYVTVGVFRLALMDYYYNLSGGFSDEERNDNDEKYSKELKNLTKTNAKKILKQQLKIYGTQGCYHDGFFEAATDVEEQRNFWFEECNKWVLKNYPNLK